MRQRFGEGKAHLMRIEGAREQHRDKCGGGLGSGLASLANAVAAFLVVRFEFGASLVQAPEHAAMPRKNKNVIGDFRAEKPERTQVVS
ncbi:hypothetical protein ACFSZS_27420 [Seohaeicola zhoushanensis]